MPQKRPRKPSTTPGDMPDQGPSPAGETPKPPTDTDLLSGQAQDAMVDATPPYLPALKPSGYPVDQASEDPEIPGFEIEGVLGRGGMGVVYLGRQVELNRLVAIKMVRGYVDDSARKRFAREAKAIAAISHPNVVAIHEVGEHRGQPFLVMEYISDGNLETKYRDQLPRFDEASQLVAKLSHAVQALHDAGVVHRDLKPANVLITQDGTVKVSDLGLAKMPVEGEPLLTPTEAILGTPSYMAPEQASPQEETTSQADVFSLGAILYRLLTGRPPFLGDTVVDTVLQVRSEDPLPPRRLRSRLPRDLETICLKCLEKRPSKRYSSAVALAEDLECYLERKPIRARRISSTERVVKWIRRRPAIASLIVATALVITILATSRTLLIEEQRQTNEFANLALQANRDLTRFGAEDLLYVSDAEPIRQMMLRRALQANRRMIALRGDLPHYQLEMALTHLSSGKMNASMGETEQAHSSFNSATAILDRIARNQSPQFIVARSDVRTAMGELCLFEGEYTRAQEWFAKALEDLESAPPSSKTFLAKTRIFENLASTYFYTGQSIEGSAKLKACEALLAQTARDTSNPRLQWVHLRLSSDLCEYYCLGANWEMAEAVLQRFNAASDSHGLHPETGPTRADHRMVVGKLTFQRALVRTATGQMREDSVPAELNSELGVMRQIVADYPTFVGFRVGLARSLSAAANVMAVTSRQKQMVEYDIEVMTLAEQKPVVPELQMLGVQARIDVALARTENPMGVTVAAREWQTALDDIEALPNELRDSYVARLYWGRATSYLGQFAFQSHKPDEAIELLHSSRDVQLVLMEQAPEDYRPQRHYAWTMAYLGEAENARAETLADAELSFRAALNAMEPFIKESNYASHHQEGLKVSTLAAYGLANSLAFQKRFDEAKDALELSLEYARLGEEEFVNDNTFAKHLTMSQQAIFHVQLSLKDHQGMIETLRSVAVDQQLKLGDLVDVAKAVIQALSVLATVSEMSESERTQLTNEYAEFAIVILDRALLAGMKPEHVTQSSDWKLLHETPQFKALLNRLRLEKP